MAGTIWLALIAGCGAPATGTVTPPSNVSSKVEPVVTTKPAHVPPFGDFDLADGEVVIMDHNSGDGRVHVLAISRDYLAVKRSWTEQPRSEVTSVPVQISVDERRTIAGWADQLWPMAPNGRLSLVKPPPDGTNPPYEWAVVLRRGGEVRVIEGGTGGSNDAIDTIIEGAVDFLDMHF
jgi:hypothetical protein